MATRVFFGAPYECFTLRVFEESSQSSASRYDQRLFPRGAETPVQQWRRNNKAALHWAALEGTVLLLAALERSLVFFFRNFVHRYVVDLLFLYVLLYGRLVQPYHTHIVALRQQNRRFTPADKRKPTVVKDVGFLIKYAVS